jgi:hypothetical protein
MKRWRIAVVAGLTVGALLAVRPAAAASDDALVTRDEVTESNDDVWSQVGWGALTGLSNLIYIPAKVVYASLGGLTGSLALGLTGGDVSTAENIWEPSLYGDYFLTPSMIQGEEPISFAGAPAGLTESLPDDEPPPPAPAPRMRHRDS